LTDYLGGIILGVLLILLGLCSVIASLVLSIISIATGKPAGLGIAFLIVGMLMIQIGRRIN
jgi:hypothetical protein